MSRRTILAIGVLAVFVLALLALQTPLLATARGLAWDVLVRGVANAFSIRPLELDTTVQEQMERLLTENIRLRTEATEYAQLKEQLGSPSFASFRAIPAQVHARPIDTFNAQVVINKGAADGVTLDAPAVLYSGTMVGVVRELNEHTAVVQLLVHPSTSVTAEVDHERRPRGLLVGRHYTSLKLLTIPRDVELTSGQAVVTVGRDTLPPGLLLGRIATVEYKENEAYQEATLQLPYDVDQLRAVSILVLP